MLESTKAPNWMTVPWELQGPETERTMLIEDDVLHLSDNETTEILGLKTTYYVCFAFEFPRCD